MPEGQVSHRNALRLGAALTGCELVRVEVPEPRLAAQRLDARLPGERVSGTRAVGKHHLLHLGAGGRSTRT